MGGGKTNGKTNGDMKVKLELVFEGTKHQLRFPATRVQRQIIKHMLHELGPATIYTTQKPLQ